MQLWEIVSTSYYRVVTFEPTHNCLGTNCLPC